MIRVMAQQIFGKKHSGRPQLAAASFLEVLVKDQWFLQETIERDGLYTGGLETPRRDQGLANIERGVQAGR